MFRIKAIGLIFGLLLSGQVQAACEITDFKDVNFSSLSQQHALSLLSTQTNSASGNTDQNASGSIIIPGISTPIGGSWSQKRSFAQEATRLLRVNLSGAEQQTVFSSALSDNGLAAYLGCTRNVPAYIDYPKEIFSANLITLTLRYNGRTLPAKVGVPVLAGGRLVAPPPAEMINNSDAFIQIARDGNGPVQFSVTVDGYGAEIVIPARPAFELVPEPFGTEIVESWSGERQGHILVPNRKCWTSPPDSLFVPGSARVVGLTLRGEGMNRDNNRAEVTTDEPRRLCLTVYADSNSKRTGAHVLASVEATLLRAQPIKY